MTDIATPATGLRILRAADRRPGLAVFLILGAIYLATSSWTLPYHIDALTNVMTAWKLGTEGTVVLTEYEDFTGEDHYNVSNQLVATERGPISKYPPGTALLAAPAYLLAPDRQELTIEYNQPTETGAEPRYATIELPAVWPGSLVAALATAGAMAILALTMAPLIGGRWALITGLAVGLGTSFWSVAADALWQHGPAALWMALGLLGFSRDRHLLGSAAFGLAVVTRPQTAVIVAIIGIWIAVKDRSLLTLLKAGLPAAAGMAAYLAYNRWAFSAVIDQAAGGYWVEGIAGRSWWDTVSPFVGAFLTPYRGLLVWSPIVLVAALGIPKVWRTAPSWAKAAAVGGLVFLLVQVRGNGYEGGESFAWYRYQLEALFVAAPLLALTARAAWERSAMWMRLLTIALGFSVIVHTYAAIV